MREITQLHEATDVDNMDSKTKAKTRTHATRLRRDIHIPTTLLTINTRETWRDEWIVQKNLLRQISVRTQQCLAKEAWGANAKLFTGDYPRGDEQKLTLIREMLTLLGKCPCGQELHDTTQERDAWEITMLRYTKDEHTKAHKARTPTQERECETFGDHPE